MENKLIPSFRLYPFGFSHHCYLRSRAGFSYLILVISPSIELIIARIFCANLQTQVFQAARFCHIFGVYGPRQKTSPSVATKSKTVATQYLPSNYQNPKFLWHSNSENRDLLIVCEQPTTLCYTACYRLKSIQI